MSGYSRLFATVVAIGLGAVSAFVATTVNAEYGDVVINNYSQASDMRPVVFPHWFHRVRFRCKVCHGDLGFQFKAGGNDINMAKIIDGQFCGACHDGQLAWSIENCDLCHSGNPGLETQVHNSVVGTLAAPKPKSAADTAAAAEAKPDETPDENKN